MIRHTVALRYAKALFRIDRKTHAFQKRIKDFEYLFGLCKQRPKFLRILQAPLIAQTDKKALLTSALKGHVDLIFLHFILFLNKKNRLNILDDIFVEYKILVDSEEQISEAKIVSKMPIQPSAKHDLVAKLQQFYNKKIVLREHVEPKILGGTFLLLGNKLIDSSIKTRLEKLESHLLGLDICR